MARRSLIFFFFVVLSLLELQAQHVAIIPQPQSVQPGNGVFSLPKELVIKSVPEAAGAIQHFKRIYFDDFRRFAIENTALTPHLRFFRLQKDADVDEEYYELTVTSDVIEIKAASEVGFFRATTSLLQLIAQANDNKSMQLASLHISDRPRYGWRGFMLDESRHFFGKEKVKQLLDWMAFYKLNTFHWHLTDEPAWRIAIQRYPLLTLVGGIGTYTNTWHPAQYYTQSDVREIVSYAAKLHINVIPEIDMPGHATAANRAYPEFSGGGTKEHPHFTFHPAKRSTYSFLTNVLKEVNNLFPSNLLHLGGDEVAYGSDSWNADATIDSLKKANQYTSNREVETYFIRQMADSVYKLGAKILLWDEMADAGLPKDKSIMFWWRHDKIEQLDLIQANGYPTVICPRLPFYFDFVQDEKDKHGRKWGGRFNPLASVYNYDVTKLEQRYPDNKLILGIQANLWTERVASTDKLDYMVFPRMAALAELAWTSDERKDFDTFQSLLQEHLHLYKAGGIYYYDPFSTTNLEPYTPKIDRGYLDNAK